MEEQYTELRQYLHETDLTFKLHYIEKWRNILIASILIGSLFLTVAIVLITKHHNGMKFVDVVMTNHDIKTGEMITTTDIVHKKIPLIYSPENRLNEFSTSITARNNLPKNHILNAYDTKTFVSPDSIVQKLEKSKVATVIDLNLLKGGFPKIAENDHVTLYTTNTKSKKEDVYEIVIRAKVLVVDRKSTSNEIRSITLEVTPEESKNILLAYGKDFNVNINIVQ